MLILRLQLSFVSIETGLAENGLRSLFAKRPAEAEKATLQKGHRPRIRIFRGLPMSVGHYTKKA